jgi:glycosyltransferase involved in cell wall biosynthesis
MPAKILHLSSFDLVGGAARSAYRIHQGLQQAGLNSQMLVQYKVGTDPSVHVAANKVTTRIRSWLDQQPLKSYPQPEQFFSVQHVPAPIAHKVSQFKPDIINLNWICNGFVPVASLQQFNCPIVWTLQDMWAMTGGCHYTAECDRYQKSCGYCPQLQSNQETDLSRQTWRRKSDAWRSLNLTLVAPSTWMKDCVQASSLLQQYSVEVIPFGLDIQAYAPMDQLAARSHFNLPLDQPLILFGAIDATGDSRKGFHLLRSALKILSQQEWAIAPELVIFGSAAPTTPIDLGFKAHYLGQLNCDADLRAAYAAADVMVAPSIQEAFGQTASESLACGTPVVVFQQTGLADIVEHQKNGYLAAPQSAEDLAHGIAWVLAHTTPALRQSARARAEQEFSQSVQAQRYMNLFERLL